MTGRPAVVFGGASPEHDISILTGLQAAHALADRDPHVVYWSRAGEWFEVPADSQPADFAEGVPRRSTALQLVVEPGGGFQKASRRPGRNQLEVALAVNCCHGAPGEDGAIQGVFDLIGVPYTGPSQRGAAIGMDKLAFTAAAAAAGLPTLPTWHITPATATDAKPPLGWSADGPLIVKPRFGGSSIGIEIVDDANTAKALVAAAPAMADGAVVQPYLDGVVDLNVAVRTWPELQFSSVEKPLRAGDAAQDNGAGAAGASATAPTAIYTYAEKYLTGSAGMASAPRELPANLPPQVTTAVLDAARACVGPAMVRSVARIDFLYCPDAGHNASHRAADGGGGSEQPEQLWVNEINTIPGSLSWYLFAEKGVTFDQLLSDMIDEALAGPTRRFSTQGADGTALRSVGSIASKLA